MALAYAQAAASAKRATPSAGSSSLYGASAVPPSPYSSNGGPVSSAAPFGASRGDLSASASGEALGLGSAGAPVAHPAHQAAAFASLLSRLPASDAAALLAASRAAPSIVDVLVGLGGAGEGVGATAAPAAPPLFRSVGAQQQQPPSVVIVEGLPGGRASPSGPTRVVNATAPGLATEYSPPRQQPPPSPFSPPPRGEPRGEPLFPALPPSSDAATALHASPARALALSKARLVERLPPEAKHAALDAALERRRVAEARGALVLARLSALPGEASALEEHLRAAVGRSGAEERSGHIRRVLDARRSLQARAALLRLAMGDAGLLEEEAASGGARVRGLDEDARANLALLETAGTELAKQPWEVELSPSVLHMCVDQARRLREGALGGGEAEAAAALAAHMGAMQRLCGRARAVTAARAAEWELAVCEARAGSAELSQRLVGRREELARAASQRDRVEEEFNSLRATVGRYKDSEASSDAALEAEVGALEVAAAAKRGDAEVHWREEMEAARRTAAAEAEVCLEGALQRLLRGVCSCI